jgi:hypothetical protein
MMQPDGTKDAEDAPTRPSPARPGDGNPEAGRRVPPVAADRAGATNDGRPEVAGFDFAVEEIAPTERLKEGFTGQER